VAGDDKAQFSDELKPRRSLIPEFLGCSEKFLFHIEIRGRRSTHYRLLSRANRYVLIFHPELFPCPKIVFVYRHFLVNVETEYTQLSLLNAGVSQVSVQGSILYLLYTAELSATSESTTATFSEDTAVLATDSDPAIASQKLQTSKAAIQKRFKNGE
jgi:hypothetical protein